VHAESVEELHRVAARALSANRVARVSLRLNPGVEADTHAHIATGHDEAKFGIPMADLAAALDAARAPGLALVGLSSHVGSQMTTTDAYTDGARAICEAAHAAITAGFPLELLDLGGGMGIDYGDGCPSAPADFVRAAAAIVRDAGLGHLRLLCEPGRALVGAHGVLVARVIQTKRWRRPDTLGWVLLDAGMNDLVRPAMYGARHRIEPLRTTAGAPDGRWRVAGPVCESSDDFGTFELPDPPPPAVVIRDAGAYGFAMASQYNGRALATEVFLENGAVSAVSPGATVAAWVAARLAT
jgi:diaminopimelate decarboxylase